MADRELREAAAAIERVRSLRVRPGPDRRASGAVEALRASLGRRVRETGGMVEAWRAVVPDGLGARTAVGGFKGGVVTIEVPDTGTRYLVERWLRGGGAHVFRGCAPATVRRVVVRVRAGGAGVHT